MSWSYVHPPRFTSRGRRPLGDHIDGDEIEAQVEMLSGADHDPRPVLRVQVIASERAEDSDMVGNGDDEDAGPWVAYVDPRKMADLLIEHGYAAPTSRANPDREEASDGRS